MSILEYQYTWFSFTALLRRWQFSEECFDTFATLGFLVIQGVFTILCKETLELFIDSRIVGIVSDRVVLVEKLDYFWVSERFGEIWKSGRHRPV